MEKTPSVAEQLGIPAESWEKMSPSERLTRFRAFLGPQSQRQRPLGYRPTEAEQEELDGIALPVQRLERYREMARAAE